MSKALALQSNGTIALADMSVPQLTEACRMLDQCQERYDKLSGICATMRGLVLTEVKHKLAHGKFLPWLGKNFDKTRKTASQDMRLARAFCKSNPRVTFDTLGRDLASTIQEIESANIDLRHPLVREVAGWVGERTRYQLLLDFPIERGGHHPRKGPPKDYDPNSAEENARDLWLPIIEFIERDGIEERSWKDLPKAEFDRLRAAHLDMGRAMKGAK